MILHVDMDAFFVSVELLDRPDLVGRPVVVGGGGPRGVVAAASYEARASGVHSAMPGTRARRLCPQAVFLEARHDRYREVSESVMEIFSSFTPLVEPLSLDEAFLDVSGLSRRHDMPSEIGDAIRHRVREEEGLTCSVGIATSKSVAKLASVVAKPIPSPRGPKAGRGVVEVHAGHEQAFLDPLPVQALWGVGPVTLARLERLGVCTVADVVALDVATLGSAIGVAGSERLAQLCRGIDPREVVPDRKAKSIGHEQTYPVDLVARADVDHEVARLADAVASRLHRAGVEGRTVTLKVRATDFATITRSRTVEPAVAGVGELRAIGRSLLEEAPTNAGVRLLGLSVSGLGPPAPRQLALRLEHRDTQREADPAAVERAEHVVHTIRERFGRTAIGPAALVDRPERPGHEPIGDDGR